ncbi:MAG TPA: hypothetical protein PK006_09545 [Saprospiraceae bacterium]|nr:hypothetical protein [Saprospiraceae bacterium]
MKNVLLILTVCSLFGLACNDDNHSTGVSYHADLLAQPGFSGSGHATAVLVDSTLTIDISFTGVNPAESATLDVTGGGTSTLGKSISSPFKTSLKASAALIDNLNAGKVAASVRTTNGGIAIKGILTK